MNLFLLKYLSYLRDIIKNYHGYFIKVRFSKLFIFPFWTIRVFPFECEENVAEGCFVKRMTFDPKTPKRKSF